MRPRTTMLAVPAATIAVALVAIAPFGGDDPYTVRAQLTDAAGLRDGAEVVIGGVKAGEVKLTLDERSDRVNVDLELEDGRGPVGRDARFAIASVNLLGQKRVDLDPGNRDRPAPDGFAVPASRVTRATDLDQVLGVLDADTRTRLGALLNEAGLAFTGRQGDFVSLLKEFPPAMVDLERVVDRVTGDNRTVGTLVERSDRFIAELARERRSISRVVDAVGQTSETVAARRAQLRETLRRAPATLRTIQAFLGDLRETTVPLGPAARDLSATAPHLASTLDQLEPFRKAATPTLARATSVAPRLTDLGTRATPVLRRAVPTLASLTAASEHLAPVSDILDNSAQNLLATMENWSRAIQLRDGLSHVFRAEASVSPQILDAAIKRMIGPPAATRRKRQAARPSSSPARPAPAKPTLPATPKLPKVPLLPGLSDTVNGVLDTLRVPRPGKPEQPSAALSDDTSALLDYLLGR